MVVSILNRSRGSGDGINPPHVYPDCGCFVQEQKGPRLSSLGQTAADLDLCEVSLFITGV